MILSTDVHNFLIFNIVFFLFCSTVLLQMFFLSSNRAVIKTIFIYLLTYGGLVSAFEIYKGRNDLYYGISIGSFVGAAFGAASGFYVGYQICILVNIIDSENIIESSSIALTIAWITAEIGRQIGGFLGNFLLLKY